eukprot:gene12602-19520_t
MNEDENVLLQFAAMCSDDEDEGNPTSGFGKPGLPGGVVRVPDYLSSDDEGDCGPPSNRPAGFLPEESDVRPLLPVSSGGQPAARVPADLLPGSPYRHHGQAEPSGGGQAAGFHGQRQPVQGGVAVNHPHHGHLGSNGRAEQRGQPAPQVQEGRAHNGQAAAYGGAAQAAPATTGPPSHQHHQHHHGGGVSSARAEQGHLAGGQPQVAHPHYYGHAESNGPADLGLPSRVQAQAGMGHQHQPHHQHAASDRGLQDGAPPRARAAPPAAEFDPSVPPGGTAGHAAPVLFSTTGQRQTAKKRSEPYTDLVTGFRLREQGLNIVNYTEDYRYRPLAKVTSDVEALRNREDWMAAGVVAMKSGTERTRNGKKLQSSEPYTDPVTAFRLREQGLNLVNYTDDYRYHPLAKVTSDVEALRNREDWMAAGVVVMKSGTERTRNGKKFVKLRLHDLQGNSALLLAFDSAYDALWRVDVGAVVAVLQPSLLPANQSDANGPINVAMSCSNSAHALVVGQSVDLGSCPATKKAGGICGGPVNKNAGTGYCRFHLSQARAAADRDVNNRMRPGSGGAPPAAPSSSFSPSQAFAPRQ